MGETHRIEGSSGLLHPLVAQVRHPEPDETKAERLLRVAEMLHVEFGQQRASLPEMGPGVRLYGSTKSEPTHLKSVAASDT